MRFLLLLSLFLLACSAPTATKEKGLIGSAEPEVDQTSGLLWYLIDIDEKLTVKTRLFSPLDRTKFYLPGNWAGRSDWSQRISVIGAEGPDGPRFMTIDRDQGVIEIDAREQPWVELNYTVDLTAGERMFPQYEDGNVFAFVPTFVVLPAGQVLARLKNIPVEVHAPEDWLVSSTWPIERSDSEHDTTKAVWGFVASNAAELNDAFIAAGPNLSADNDDVLRVIVDAQHANTFSPLNGVARDVVKTYRQTYGDVGPASMFIRTKSSGPDEYVGMGRRGGFVVQLDPKRPMNDELKLLVAHEAFHLWNGHWLIPNPDRESESRWFKEGVTHYIALKTLGRQGAVSQKFVLEELARIGANYMRNPAVAELARKDPRMQVQPIDRVRLPYDRGALLAFSIDAMLHRASGGERSIEDWIIAVSNDAHAKNPGYELSVLHEALEGTSGGDADLHLFWTRSVRGGEPLDLRATFALGDLHWLPPRSNQPSKLVALDRKKPVYVQLFQ